MKKLHGVVWSEGLFLTPQHFQARERSVENNIHFRSAASNFANWGITELAVDMGSLANGVFALDGCSGVLADGLAFSIPEADDPPPSRVVEEYFPITQKTLDVFLAIRRRLPQGKDVWLPENSKGPISAADTPRYVAGTDPVPDENRSSEAPNESEPKSVGFAKRNFRLLFATESLDDFTSLRIARLARNSTGGFILVPKYVAPCLDLGCSQYLMSLLKGRIERLAARANGIAGRRQEGIGTIGFANTEDLWLLHTINTYLPALKHIWQVRHGHPEVPYLTMLHLAGALCSFSSGADASQLPDYDHVNLGECFAGLNDRIEELLEVFSKSKCVEIPLLKEGLFWLGKLDEHYYFRNSHFFLAVRARMGIPDLIREVPQRIKIASKEKIDLLYRSAVPGILLLHEASPPVGCPSRAGTQYFRLNQTGPLWEEIKKLRDIGIYVHHQIDEPELQLLIALE